MLVVTMSECEARSISSAALKELLKIVKDQSGERSVVGPCIEQRVCNLEGLKHESFVLNMFS